MSEEGEKHDKPWTAEERETLTKLRRRGVSCGIIGKVLGRSRGSIAGANFRLGLTKPSPQLSARLTRGPDEVMLIKRRRIANEIVDKAGNVSDFAKAAGLSMPNASQWLRRNAPDLQKELRYAKAAGWRNAPASLVLPMLLVVRDGRRRGDSDAQLARQLRITVHGLRKMLEIWATDSVEQAIEDLTPEPEAEPEAERTREVEHA